MPTLLSTLPSAWNGIFSNGYSRDQFTQLSAEVEAEYATNEICPGRENIFRALELVNPEAVKVVIVGQDPYPTPGNAHGLSFSVQPPARIPGSLITIFRELERSVTGWVRPSGGNLEPWAKQGVLLLNSILTVRARAPMSHAGLGWEDFTQAILRYVQRQSPFLVFMLWGSKAQTVKPLIDTTKHAVLECSHPSFMAQNRIPLGKGFVGNAHFIEANRQLVVRGRAAIDWRL